MPIINVNTFQDGISKKDYLLTYTDQYIKQSLANLGQRIGIKGDSITTDTFNVIDLFPKYTNTDLSNIFVRLTYNISENIVSGELVTYEGGIIKGLDKDNNPNSTFTTYNVNNYLTNITSDDYYSEYFELDNIINNDVDGYHRDSARIYKNENYYQYSLLGHKRNSSNSSSDYDKEFICEKIGTSNEFEDGFRICIKNENTVLNSNDHTLIHEHLALFHLYKNSLYDGDDDKVSPYLLDIYNVNQTSGSFYEIGDFTDETKLDIDENIYKGNSGIYLTNTPSQIINIINSGTNWDTNDITPQLTKAYSKLPVYINKEKNQYFFIKDKDLDYEWAGQNKLLNTNIPHDITDDDQDDEYEEKDWIESKLEYFTNDLVILYPKIKEIYNEILYKSQDNLKTKERIFVSLIKKLYSQYVNSLDNSEDVQIYSICLPTDFELVYNTNSNDKSIIYNTGSDVNVQFINNNLYIEENVVNIYDYIQKINNTLESNQNVILATSIIKKMSLYELTVTYNDDIIDNIYWRTSFALPYIDENGYWIVNDINTSIKAEGVSDKINNLIIMSSLSTKEDDDNKYKIHHAGDQDLIENSIKFELKEAPINIDNTNSDNIRVYAWVPSSAYLTSNTDTKVLAALNNALILNMSNPYMQSYPDLYTYKCSYYSYSGLENLLKNSSDLIYSSYYFNTAYANTDYAYSYIFIGYPSDNSLLNKFGTDSIITTLWHCVQDTETSRYSFTYITRPDNEQLALDLTYLSGLKYLIKYFTQDSTYADNSFFRQLVFSPIDTIIKHTVGTTTSTKYPVIKNLNESDYLVSNKDPNTSIGNDNENYSNNLNLSVGFYDKVSRQNGQIIDISNSNNRLFHIDDYNHVTYVGYMNVTIDKDGNAKSEVSSKQVSTYYGTISALINKTNTLDYIPKTYNGNGWTDQYPFLDLKEVLVNNHNVVNRSNIISFEKNEKIGKNVIYNAYIGTPFDQADKSILHIGTSRRNVNLGTTTMLSNDDVNKLTPMSGLSIDFDNIQVNGDFNINGNFSTEVALWNTTYVSGIKVYSTTTIPSGITNKIQDITDIDNKLFGIKTENFDVNNRYCSIKNERDISYINISYLLQNMKLISETDNVSISGCPSRLSYYITDNTQFIKDLESAYNSDSIIDKKFEPYLIKDGTGNIIGINKSNIAIYKSSYYIQLSTDLTDPENIVCKINDNTIVVGNPIEISYYEVTDQEIEYEIEKQRTVYAFTYPSSYTEVWKCNGCDACSGASCGLIKVCKFSYVLGNVNYSYGFIYNPVDIKNNKYEFKVDRPTIDDENNITSNFVTITSNEYPELKNQLYSNLASDLAYGTVFTYSNEFPQSFIYTTSYIDYSRDYPCKPLCYISTLGEITIPEDDAFDLWGIEGETKYKNCFTVVSPQTRYGKPIAYYSNGGEFVEVDYNDLINTYQSKYFSTLSDYLKIIDNINNPNNVNYNKFIDYNTNLTGNFYIIYENLDEILNKDPDTETSEQQKIYNQYVSYINLKSLNSNNYINTDLYPIIGAVGEIPLDVMSPIPAWVYEFKKLTYNLEYPGQIYDPMHIYDIYHFALFNNQNKYSFTGIYEGIYTVYIELKDLDKDGNILETQAPFNYCDHLHPKIQIINPFNDLQFDELYSDKVEEGLNDDIERYKIFVPVTCIIGNVLSTIGSSILFGINRFKNKIKYGTYMFNTRTSYIYGATNNDTLNYYGIERVVTTIDTPEIIQASYLETYTETQTFTTTQKNINVREIMTSHSKPEYFSKHL